MAVRITELNELSVVAQSDVLAIVDIGAGQTKKIQASNLLLYGISGMPSGSIDISQLDQNSATKLGSVALADTGVGAGSYGNATGVTTITVNAKGQITAAGITPIVIPASSVTGLATVATSGTYASLSGLPTLGTLSSQNAGSVVISGGTVTGITDIAIADGGTGASTASGARTNLGLSIGSDVQAYDAGLASIAELATSSGQILGLNGSDIYTTIALSDYGKTLIDDNSAVDARATLGLGSIATKNIISSTDIDTGAVVAAAIASGTITSVKYQAGSVNETAIGSQAVTTAKIANSGVTAEKLADNSVTTVTTGAPVGNGHFIGQQWLDINTKYVYIWDGSAWDRQAAINEIDFVDSSPLSFAVTYPDNYSAEIAVGLDNQAINTVFAGPASGASTAPAFRALLSSDLPLATASLPGAVTPGAGLSVNGIGTISHTNTTTPGTYAGRVTIDANGHIVTALATLEASDIPNIDASKITTGQFTSNFLSNNSVTAAQLADYGIAQISETSPIPEFAGQWWINPNDRSAYIWVGEVTPSIQGYWLNLGYGSPTQINLRFGGTYNASGNTVQSINSYGIEAGLTIGQPLSSPNTSNNGLYLIVTTSGVGTTPAPSGALSVGNWVLSQGVGSNWTTVNLGIVGDTILDEDVLVDGGSLNPVSSGIASQEDFNSIVWGRVQIGAGATAGIVRGSTEIIVASGTGIMSIGTIDDGSY